MMNNIHEEEWWIGSENVDWMMSNYEEGSPNDQGDMRAIHSPSHGALAVAVFRMREMDKSPNCESQLHMLSAAPKMYNTLQDCLEALENMPSSEAIEEIKNKIISAITSAKSGCYE